MPINISNCENPYYVIVNYNKPESQVSLYIEKIYGKIKSLAVAPILSRASWEEMLENDMENIDISLKKQRFFFSYWYIQSRVWSTFIT